MCRCVEWHLVSVSELHDVAKTSERPGGLVFEVEIALRLVGGKKGVPCGGVGEGPEGISVHGC